MRSPSGSKSKITYRLIIFTIATIFSLFFCMPTFLSSYVDDNKTANSSILNFLTTGPKINLGLDLKGGLYMLLGVDTNETINSKMKSIASSVNYYLTKEEILVDKFKMNEDNLYFSIIDEQEQVKIDTMLKSIKGLDIKKGSKDYTINLTEEEKAATAKFAIDQAVETIRNRLDMFGLAEPTVAKQGEEKILVELPGIKTAQDEERARELIAKSAHLQLMALDEKRQNLAQSITQKDARAYGDIVLSDVKNEQFKYLIKEIPILDGSMLIDAKVAFDQRNNMPIINFTLNSEGARIFGDFTGANVGNRLAIVLDNKVYSAPVINERIGGGSGQISGRFSVEEANDLAIALRSGALLAPVHVLEKRSIGPSLGQDSIDKAMVALYGASILVILFMAWYYMIAGIFANIALITNILLLIATMSFFGATLTLPGMAGIVLTVGMAVDANVIINERIREMFQAGASVRLAIEKGYENAMSAIIDSNLTTLITSAALYAYGTGPIKGFAVTMSIGILASMLTAILGTHGMFEFFVNKIEKSGNLKLWFGYKVRKVENANI
ncbi:preprotein translocase subunit SecD [Campylobacter sputorum subsp. bubulus]|uniref:Protein translocase subunit SecD n=1 Tax=Campylobacter sputorum subsp. sputorum TaxID=32024 RepID=A0A381DGV6_9BACT|nr:protein translocase subunit SecD [Campylobacter sputorum]ASM34967.1 protein-export membrane protein SecD [Campylobacter sputorum aubsp. sputorum RM3237]KAB0581905.1 protein translocase subunit SecD [Campylobacter sputorum subsp. sputorum]QEL05158.1 protein-export membrane protein SecD [Campylobacter sputorum subsp. sputorum]SUX09524.1 preprotein translocase subunit SecD [Campylobacter sputorum subsp. sputorum]SUX30773.1 preprotein translocase subunit SecD [Campylobacter sputorum subsp. bubu